MSLPVQAWLVAVGVGMVTAATAPLLFRFAPSRRAGGVQVHREPAAVARGSLLVAVLAGLAAGLVAWRTEVPTGLVDVALVTVLIMAATVDVLVRRLPNLIVVPATGALAVLLVVVEVKAPEAGRLTVAFGAFLVVLTFLTVYSLVAPRHLGMGDARFLALAAMVLAYPGLDRLGLMFLLLAGSMALLAAWWFRRGLVGVRQPLGPVAATASVLAICSVGAISAVG